MKIVKFSDKYALLDNNGYILHTEKNAEDILYYLHENFALSVRNGVGYDKSTVYADERGFYVTESELLQYWQYEEDHNEYPRFSNFLCEVCGKNGTLTRL